MRSLGMMRTWGEEGPARNQGLYELNEAFSGKLEQNQGESQ